MSKRARARRIPRYRLHKPSGRAVVTLSGRDYYLGEYNSPGSRQEYARLLAEYLNGPSVSPDDSPAKPDFTVNELLVRYLRYAREYYPKHRPGLARGIQIDRVEASLGPVVDLYGHTPVADFGPRCLKVIREQWIDKGLCRGYINALLGCIKRAFKWGTSEELVPPSVYHGLQSVEGLRAGRTRARETGRVRPAPVEAIEETISVLGPVLGDVVRVQILTGMRPGEALGLRPCEIDRSRDVWVYRPGEHKTAHHGHERAIPIGPKAQVILAEYLDRPASVYCFQPTKRTGGKGPAGDHYTSNAYAHAIRIAADRADRLARRKALEAGVVVPEGTRLVPRWHPHQLRHNAATEIVKAFGWEVARLVLGHRSVDMTRTYAEDDLAKAIDAARKIG